MSRFFYDLHMHSCLSPCGSEDMTPYNLVHMAELNELDIIALTDHNTSKNCPAALAAATDCHVKVMPGMELCTSEEAHVVCLFDTLEKAMIFDEYVETKIPPIENDVKIFGDQQIMNAEDQLIGSFPYLLVSAADITLTELPGLMRRFGGVAFPAHIDKSSYSVLAALGMIPPECNFHAAEVTMRGDIAALREQNPILEGMPLLLNSDAHYLEDIHPQRAWFELSECTPPEVLKALSGHCLGYGRG